MKFYKIAAKMLHVTINTAEAREHRVYIEREIRLVKECGRATLKMMPFREVSKQVIIKLVYFTALWINDFPEKAGISKVYSPCDIISGQKLDFKLHYII